MYDQTRQSARTLLADLRNGRISARELMQSTLDRIDAVNGRVNAIVALRERSELLDEARRADDGPVRGALHGLPIAVKDLVDVAGLVSTQGSPLYRDHVPGCDDLIAARMRGAGALLIGKTNVPEFGLGSHSVNPVYGATRNPYDLTRSCGGSSGGAAVALATGMLALADGSDMMGSLRNPAAWNNVYGFRPTWGRVPSEPAGDTFLHQLSTHGPMARNPRDLALLLDVIAGPDPRQPHAPAMQPVQPIQPAATRGRRIAWLGDWGGAYPCEGDVLTTLNKALKIFDELGCHVEAPAPPFDADLLWQSWITLRAWKIAAKYLPMMDQAAIFGDNVMWEVERGASLTAMDVHRASVIRSDWFRCAAGLFEDYDALVLPSAQVWPFDVALDYPKRIGAVDMDCYHRWMQCAIPAGLIGLPCLAVPAGFGAAGLPTGMQVMGPRGGDRAILELGQAYHEATRWPQRHPAMT